MIKLYIIHSCLNEMYLIDFYQLKWEPSQSCQQIHIPTHIAKLILAQNA